MREEFGSVKKECGELAKIVSGIAEGCFGSVDAGVRSRHGGNESSAESISRGSREQSSAGGQTDHSHGDPPANANAVSQRNSGTASNATRQSDNKNAKTRVISRRRNDPYTTGATVIINSNRDVDGSHPIGQRQGRDDDRIQSDGTMDRSNAYHNGERDRVFSETDRHLMGNVAEVRQDGSVQAGSVHGDTGEMDGSHSKSSTESETRTSADGHDNRSHERDHEEGTRSGVHNTFSEARRSDGGNGKGRSGDMRDRGCNEGRQTQTNRNDTAIRRKFVANSLGAGNAESDQTDLELFTRFVKHTVTRVRRSTKVATGDDLLLPLHVKEVAPLSVEKLRAMMNDSTKRRFDEVWGMMLRDVQKGPDRSKSTLTHGDATKLCEAGVISLISKDEEKSRPTRATLKPFTVVETRDGSDRRRFIAWTKSHNDALEHSYTANVPLQHISYYLDRVNENVALKRDLSCGFFQMEIPYEFRSLFRFTDDVGNVFEMNRVPMGHVCAPELMHTLMAVIAGDRHYCLPQCSASSRLIVDVFVDGCRCAGNEREVRNYESWIESRARNVCATFKPAESYIGRNYDFIGAHFDHVRKQVSLKAAFALKIKDSNWKTIGQLETLMGRLIHASAVLQVRLPTYYWVIKSARRRIALLNRGLAKESDLVSVPLNVERRLRAWIKTVSENTPVTPKPARDKPASATIITDASMKGWGALLMTEDGQMIAAGKPWEGPPPEINVGETRAVRYAFEAFRERLAKNSVVDLRVDNTTVLAAVNKGHSDSPFVSLELGALLTELNIGNWTVNATYVRSESNLADPISRGRTTVWRMGERDGGRGE